MFLRFFITLFSLIISFSLYGVEGSYNEQVTNYKVNTSSSEDCNEFRKLFYELDKEKKQHNVESVEYALYLTLQAIIAYNCPNHNPYRNRFYRPKKSNRPKKNNKSSSFYKSY